MSRLSGAQVAESLLRHNYFPRIAGAGDELPPCFNSVDLSLAIAKKVAATAPRKSGYDTVQIQATRFDLAPRRLELPHPRAYCELAVHFATNWHRYSFVSDRESAFRPTRLKDGRIFSMRAISPPSRRSFGAKYRVQADVSQFYHSIYTHAVPWALVGRAQAKSNRGGANWFNELDAVLRSAHRGETLGVAIGPGTSALVGEILLRAVDKDLSGYRFSRAIDDYRFDAPDLATAEQFVIDLTRALAQYNLNLNPRKTEILPLPSAEDPQWKRRLRAASRSWDRGTRRSIDLIDDALELSEREPDASALKYVLSVLERQGELADKAVLSYVIDLAFHFPVAVPVACRALLDSGQGALLTGKKAASLLTEHAMRGRTDAVSWILFVANQIGRTPSPGSVAHILASADCLSITLLSEFRGSPRSAAHSFGLDVLKRKDEYEMDSQWLLLHQLSLSGAATRSTKDDALDSLESLGVSFVDMDATPPPPIAPRTIRSGGSAF
jgi:hypothetical protein